MGTIAAPSYATIFMGNFEEKFIYPHILADCLIYCRFIDDIFLICTLPETSFINFIADLNTRHESIKFDFEISKTQISFLDTVVYIDKNRRIQTTLYKKPTDTSNYLHFRSSHPKHLKENLPYSQALRLKRICSEETEYHKNCTKMRDNFIKRGYNKSLVTQQIEKANAKSRHDTLTYKTYKTNKRIPLTTTFNPTLPEISNILKSNWNILQIKPEVKECFPEPPIISYRRNKNLRDMIGSNEIINNKVRRNFKLNKHHSIKFCKPCNTKGCLCCNQLKYTSEFKSSITNRTYKIFHETSCKSKFVIYLLECKQCKLQYIGKSEWQFNIRLNNYRSHIKNLEIEKLLPVEKHFLLPNHDFERDAVYTLIEKIEHTERDDARAILEKRECAWMTHLQTIYPNGLNSRFTNPLMKY